MPATLDTLPQSLTGVGTHETVPLDGDRVLGYATYGDPDGRAVVALHGVPGCRWFGALYHDAARDAGVRVVAPDRPGRGRSTHAPDLTVADTPGDVAALADHLGVDRFGVVGFSAGAPHALACATALPERVTATALVAPLGPPDGPGGARFIRVLQWVATHAPRLLRPAMRLFASRNRGADPEDVARSYTESAALGERVADGATAADVLYADFLGTFEGGAAGFVRDLRQVGEPWGFDLSAVPGTVRCWHGSADENVPLAAGRALADRLPDCEFVVRDGEDHGETAVRTRDAVLDAVG